MIPEELLLLLLWAGFAASLAWYGVLTLILRYHWRSYTIKGEAMALIQRRYFIASGIVIVGALLSLLIYTATV